LTFRVIRALFSPGLLVKANVLIDQSGRARLADFGLLTILSDPANLLSSSSCMEGGTVRWMSPELIDPQQFGFEKSRPTKSSDCYALGMVIYETISGNQPFHKDKNHTVSLKVLRGERPPRGLRFTETLWNMLELCWVSQPNDRPSIETVLQCLEGIPSLPEPVSPGVDEEMGEGDDWDSTSDYSGVLNGTSDLTMAESKGVHRVSATQPWKPLTQCNA